MPKIIKYSRVLSALILPLCIVIILPNAFGQPASGLNNKYSLNATRDGRRSEVQSYYHPVIQGFNFTVGLSAEGMIGIVFGRPYSSIVNTGDEYPAGSGDIHLSGSGLWVGAMFDTVIGGRPRTIKSVTATDGVFGLHLYFTPNDILDETSPVDTAHPWYHASRSPSIASPTCGASQDTGAISESDYYCEYTDTNWTPGLDDHYPLGIKVLQRSYAWATAVKEPILPFDYSIINLGLHRLRGVYIGISVAPAAYNAYSDGGRNMKNWAGYWQDLRTAYVQDLKGSTASGYTILSPPQPWKLLPYYSFRWWEGSETEGHSNIEDSSYYDGLSGASYPGQPRITPDQSPYGNLNFDVFLFSFGPFDNWNPGDTLKLSFALVAGTFLDANPDNVRDNAKSALTLYARHYVPPVVLPGPNLRIEPGFKKVTLRWGYSGTGVDPMDVWDGESQTAQLFPVDSWRRRNPPEGCNQGGRIFGGFRLYRSEDPAASPNSFTLMRQWDMKDSVGPSFGYQTGIETTFVDSNLVTNKTYWYSVTSYSIPDAYVTDYVNDKGAVIAETLYAGNAESSVLANRKRINLPFSVSDELGKVLVVPNPYRVDENYTFENGGWEGRQQSWNETKRLIKFIHLPEKCTIRIYSLRGDVIATLYHEDPSRGEIEWNLISDGGRAIASGLYVFSVESEYGRQVGKFVVIR